MCSEHTAELFVKQTFCYFSATDGIIKQLLSHNKQNIPLISMVLVTLKYRTPVATERDAQLH